MNVSQEQLHRMLGFNKYRALDELTLKFGVDED